MTKPDRNTVSILTKVNPSKRFLSHPINYHNFLLKSMPLYSMVYCSKIIHKEKVESEFSTLSSSLRCSSGNQNNGTVLYVRIHHIGKRLAQIMTNANVPAIFPTKKALFTTETYNIMLSFLRNIVNFYGLC